MRDIWENMMEEASDSDIASGKKGMGAYIYGSALLLPPTMISRRREGEAIGGMFIHRPRHNMIRGMIYVIRKGFLKLWKGS